MKENFSENEDVRIFTSIKSDFYRRKMFKGTIIALLGILVIFFGGSQVTPHNIHLIGLPILLLGAALIAYGLVPLRRLTKHDQHPSELSASKKHLQYSVNGKLLFTLPIDSLSDMHYVEKTNLYGIALSLKDKTKSAVIVHDPGFNFSKFIEKSQKIAGVDLFLPYFGRRSFSRFGFLKSQLEQYHEV